CGDESDRNDRDGEPGDHAVAPSWGVVVARGCDSAVETAVEGGVGVGVGVEASVGVEEGCAAEAAAGTGKFVITRVLPFLTSTNPISRPLAASAAASGACFSPSLSR